ncbi:MAG: hypothetical protein H0T55_03060 [Rubrobacteraceae bacterium]|nr:hypothetical protein [Rubrobacteraceae bacterium]MBA3616517.1 hypothetical protein [Rubrobacteraceae bacterium]MDQ3251243.1 hypothetical protein [Actinomycetota bacterium]MDQ3436005.1 hypothetical protein [Actinomycetota bacterium]
MANEFRSIRDVVRGIKESTYEIQTESRLAYSGLKREQNITEVLEKFAWLYNLETVRRVEEACRVETDPENKERLHRVYYYLLEGYIGQQTAPLEDALVSFEARASVEVDGENIPYHNVPVLIASEHDFERRDRLREASLGVVEETNPERLEILRTSLATLADEFGHDSYTAYNAQKKRIDYSLLRSRMEGFLSETEKTYTALMGRWVEETMGLRLGEIGSHHFSYISRLPEYDEYFRKVRLLGAYERTLSGMGLDPASQKNIHIDTEERATKNPRARCYAPNPPEEVHLLIKPVGGLEDYMAFFHEAGHAQHFGNEDPALDYVERAISTSNALTEIYSFLLEHLTQNRTWLTRVVGLPDETARGVAYYAELAELFLVRRYAAKLAYELAFFENPLEEGRNRQIYTTMLSAATHFVYTPQNYLDDMDPGYYTADYLRAWITEAMLRHHLEDTYGEDWFASPEAGRFLRDLWATGEKVENEDVARMIGCNPFDTRYLVEQFLALE